MKLIKLKDGNVIPALGFGTWQLSGQSCFNAVLTALEVGYRHIDTADRYGNHREVAKAIKSSKIPRDKIFLTSKVWTTDLSYKDVLTSAERFLKELETDYLDLLLIHWPSPKTPVKEALKALDELKSQGKIKSIGVSNFNIKRLKESLETGVNFVTNQVEFHPSLNQKDLKSFCDLHKIVITAYSPLGQGEDLNLEIIKTLAKKYQKAPSQVILSWFIKKGIVAIPRSSSPERIRENFESKNFELHADDIKLIDQIGGNNRTVNPDWPEFKE